MSFRTFGGVLSGLSVVPQSPYSRGNDHWNPLDGKLDRPQGRSGRVRKISTLPVFDSRTAQFVASRYTDYSNLAHGRIWLWPFSSRRVGGWTWTETDMTFVIPKGRGLTVDENGYTSLYRLNPYRPGGSGTVHQLVQMVFNEYHWTSCPGYCIKLR
jgi:hypothetical protein